MTKHEVIEKLLGAINSKKWNASSIFGGASGTDGALNVQPADVNKAISAWLEHDDPEGVRQITGTLHIIGSLTDDDFEQIMKAIDGEE